MLRRETAVELPIKSKLINVAGISSAAAEINIVNTVSERTSPISNLQKFDATGEYSQTILIKTQYFY